MPALRVPSFRNCGILSKRYTHKAKGKHRNKLPYEVSTTSSLLEHSSSSYLRMNICARKCIGKRGQLVLRGLADVFLELQSVFLRLPSPV